VLDLGRVAWGNLIGAEERGSSSNLLPTPLLKVNYTISFAIHSSYNIAYSLPDCIISLQLSSAQFEWRVLFVNALSAARYSICACRKDQAHYLGCE
jgi:hypothetical protein